MPRAHVLTARWVASPARVCMPHHVARACSPLARAQAAGAVASTVDNDCVVTSIMANGQEVTRRCYDEGITKPEFVSNAPSHGRFESCTGAPRRLAREPALHLLTGLQLADSTLRAATVCRLSLRSGP